MLKINAVKNKSALQTGFEFFDPKPILLLYLVVGITNKFNLLIGKAGQNA